MKSRIIVAILVLMLWAGAVKATEPLSPAGAAAAFARLRTLAGEWETKSPDGNRAHLRYQVVSRGSAVMEQFVDDRMGEANAMVTLYYLDGGRLLLTHYCMAGNQPRMRAEVFDGSTGELRFGFLDATGLASPEAGHMHSARLRFVDADHFITEWEFVEGGKSKFTESAQYTRVR